MKRSTEDAIASLLAATEKKYGKGVLVQASEAKNLEIRRFSTGCLALDFALCGGWAEGRMIELIGQFSTCKSTLSTLACVEFMKAHPDGFALYVDLEGSCDKQWIRKLGGDLRRFVLSRPTGGEEAGDALVDNLRQLRQTEVPVLVILDSIAAMIPTKETEEDMDWNQPGLHAKLVTKFLRKVLVELRQDLLEENPQFTLILTNQIREKVGVMFGNPETGTGGRAREFFVSQQVKLTRESFVRKKVSVPGGKDIQETIGLKIKFIVQKNKAGGPQDERGSFRFHTKPRDGNTGGSIDNITDMVDYGLHYGVLKKVGSKLEYSGNQSTQKAFKEALKTDQKLFQAVRKDLITLAIDRFNS